VKFVVMPNFTHIGAGVERGTPKMIILCSLEYKRPTGAYSLRNFYKILMVYGQFFLGLAI